MDREQLKSVIAIIGSIGTILGLGLSIYFYEQSREVRIPRFLVDPSRIEIVSAKKISTAPITVFRSDGTQIRTDLTALRIYFWNAGKRAIKRDEILKPVRIYLADPNALIVDHKILNKSRDIINAELRSDPLTPNTSLLLDFAILEKNDGVTIQVIYEGDPKAQLRTDGIIEGPSPIDTLTTEPVDPFQGLRLIDNISTITIAVMAAVIFFYLREQSRRIPGKYPRYIPHFFLMTTLLNLVLVIFLDILSLRGISSYVPDTLLH